MFGSVYGDTLLYYTLTRAVTPGVYFLPPSTSVVMYSPELNARSDAGEFRVIKR